MRMSRVLSAAVLSALALAPSVAAQTVIPLGQFHSVHLSNGGTVILRHGPVQRVTLVSGDTRFTRVRVAGGQRLVIDNRVGECPRGYRMQLEIITPGLSAASVSNGGTIQAIGAFPAQPALDARVEQGGRLDIRAIPAETIDASVYSGGGIFIQPRQTLDGSVESGGIITYWGDPRVTRSVRDGGAVVRGKSADFDRPLSDMGHHTPALQPVAPIPPVPPIPPGRDDGR